MVFINYLFLDSYFLLIQRELATGQGFIRFKPFLCCFLRHLSVNLSRTFLFFLLLHLVYYFITVYLWNLLLLHLMVLIFVTLRIPFVSINHSLEGSKEEYFLFLDVYNIIPADIRAVISFCISFLFKDIFIFLSSTFPLSFSYKFILHGFITFK